MNTLRNYVKQRDCVFLLVHGRVKSLLWSKEFKLKHAKKIKNTIILFEPIHPEPEVKSVMRNDI